MVQRGIMIDDIIVYGLLASLVAGLATGAGALPVLVVRRVSEKLLDVMMGFAGGVMLAASAFSLLIPAIAVGGVWVAAISLAMGAFLIHLIDRFSPHTHFVAGKEGPSSHLARLWLFVIAVTIHNFPEGLAVGVSFGGGDIARGLVVATAIGLQNLPEGLAVAFPLVREHYSRRQALGYATLTGLVEPVGGLLGAAVVSLAQPILPWGLAFAAGAMIFVVSDEMIPESHRKGYEREATFGLVVGFLAMMLLDNTLA